LTQREILKSNSICRNLKNILQQRNTPA